MLLSGYNPNFNGLWLDLNAEGFPAAMVRPRVLGALPSAQAGGFAGAVDYLEAQ